MVLHAVLIVPTATSCLSFEHAAIQFATGRSLDELARAMRNQQYFLMPWPTSVLIQVADKAAETKAGSEFVDFMHDTLKLLVAKGMVRRMCVTSDSRYSLLTKGRNTQMHNSHSTHTCAHTRIEEAEDMNGYAEGFFETGRIRDFLKLACPDFEGGIRRLVDAVYGADTAGDAQFFDLWAATAMWVELTMPDGYLTTLMMAARACFKDPSGAESIWDRNRHTAVHRLSHYEPTRHDCHLIIMMVCLVGFLTGFIDKTEVKKPTLTTAVGAAQHRRTCSFVMPL